MRSVVAELKRRNVSEILEDLIEDHFENPLGGPGMFKVVTTIQSISLSILRHHDARMILDHLGCNFQLLDCMSGLLDSTETNKYANT